MIELESTLNKNFQIFFKKVIHLELTLDIIFLIEPIQKEILCAVLSCPWPKLSSPP